MRLHVVSLPHTQTTAAYSACAYTQKVRRFASMMTSLGHEVYLYASTENDADCTEHVDVIPKWRQKRILGVEGPEDYLQAPFDVNGPAWQIMNANAIEEIRKRQEPRDFLCIIAGLCQEPIVRACPDMLPVEFGIGYSGVIEGTHWVFESRAWQHVIYGQRYGAHATRGRFYDAVIPNYFDPEEFTYSEEKDDYFLFLGRLNEDKGIGIAHEVCQELDARLVVAGAGVPPEGTDYRGIVGPEERAKLLSRAKATFVPTLYLEPFGGVVVESLLSGTPVITTDFGAFPETNEHGVTGYRCRTFKDFVKAARNIDVISSEDCRSKGMRYSTKNVRHEYERYFADLEGLWGEGWTARA